MLCPFVVTASSVGFTFVRLQQRALQTAVHKRRFHEMHSDHFCVGGRKDCAAQCELRIGSGAMASAGDSRTVWKEDEIGWTGMESHGTLLGNTSPLMRAYRRRGSSSHNLEGSGADEEKKSLEKKRSRFARKLLDALHREAFRTAERFKKTEKIREYPAD